MTDSTDGRSSPDGAVGGVVGGALRSQSELQREHIVSAALALARVRLGDSAVKVDVVGTGAIKALLLGINGFLTSSRAEHEQAEHFREILRQKLALVGEQKGAIGEFPAPVIEVWEGVLCIPIVGLLDSSRSERITDAILEAVSKRGARTAIIELSKIDTMDSSTVLHLREMATAVTLLGSRCVLAGLTPSVVQTVVKMGIDMSGIHVYQSLSEALKPYLAVGG